MSETYVVRRSMTYGRPGVDRPVDRGQILELEGLVNDAKLVRLGYVSTASKGIAIVQCGKCGAKFVTDEALSSHGRERHPSIVRGDEPVIGANGKPVAFRSDLDAEKKFAREDNISPLYLDKTEAARREGTATEIHTQKRAAKKRNKAAA